MGHQVLIEDANGELVDALPYCSDACASADPHYAGWYGCVEFPDGPEWCVGCGVLINELECGCDAGVVVNRVTPLEAERCEHGGILCLDAQTMGRDS